MGSLQGGHYVLNGEFARGTPRINRGSVLGGPHVLNGQFARGTLRIKWGVC